MAQKIYRRLLTWVHPFADYFSVMMIVSKSEVLPPPVAVQRLWIDTTSCITRADDRYTEVDYAYNSENSSLAREHWEGFVANHPSWGVQSGDRVVEIGSNDGYLLSLVKKYCSKTQVIYPAKTQTKNARQIGHEIV